MPTRKNILVTGEIYHVFNKSIAEFKIFNNHSEFSRMLDTIRYYQYERPSIKFSKFIKSSNKDIFISKKEKLVEIISYCLMPTHIHLILKQLKENAISISMGNIQNSYTRYFNTKHIRKGPLWEGRFKNVLIKTDEQLLHLTRYIHLNPVTAYLVTRPEEWLFSSYREYLMIDDKKICRYDNVLDIEPDFYRKFVEDRVVYQRELAKIKDLVFE
jgi:putative transposase